MAYIIKPGDSLSKIAQQNKTTVQALLQANPSIKDPNRISAGASLNLPGALSLQPSLNVQPANKYSTSPQALGPAVPATGFSGYSTNLNQVGSTGALAQQKTPTKNTGYSSTSGTPLQLSGAGTTGGLVIDPKLAAQFGGQKFGSSLIANTPTSLQNKDFSNQIRGNTALGPAQYTSVPPQTGPRNLPITGDFMSQQPEGINAGHSEEDGIYGESYGGGGVTGNSIVTSLTDQPTGNNISNSFGGSGGGQGTQNGIQNGMQSGTQKQLGTSEFANVIDSMRSKLAYNNDLINARQLLVTNLYDHPLTEQEIAKLPPNLQDAARSGDNRKIEMNIRLLNDEIQGRTNTMDQSINYLTTAYKNDLSRAEREKEMAMANIMDFVGAYGDQAGEAIKSMYGEDYLRQLEEYGIDIGGLGSMPKTLSQLQEERLANPGTVGGTRSYVDSNGDIIEIGDKQLSAAQANLLSEGNQLSFVLDPLYNILETKKDLFGPVTGRIGQSNPYNTAAQTIDDDLRRAAQTIGKYMEGGVLRKEDEEKYRRMLPQLTDTPDVARNKLEGVTDLLKQKQLDYIDSYARAGYDVSNFVSSDSGGGGNLEQSFQEDVRNLASQMDRDQLANELARDYPELTPQQVRDAVYKMLPDGWEKTGIQSFKMEGSGSKTLGKLSAPYESSGNPGTVSTGKGDPGGVSYGTYQLTTNNVKGFVQQSKYANSFKGLTPGSSAFSNQWKAIAAKDPQGFQQEQQSYIEKTHYQPQAQKLASAGVNVNNLSPVLKDVIFSTSVQHGPATNIVLNSIKKVGPNASEEALIKEIYKQRWAGGSNFANSSQEMRNGVYNRFFGPNGEMKKALAMINNNLA